MSERFQPVIEPEGWEPPDSLSTEQILRLAAGESGAQVAPMDERVAEVTQRHRDALADTHEAYSVRQGWTLTCLWCEVESYGKTKREALEGMQRHYDRVLPEGCELR